MKLTQKVSYLPYKSLSFQKNLLNKDLSCNWVYKREHSSSISKVIFDDDGYIVENWPDDVFGEIFKQTRDLIEARERNAVESS